MLPRTESLDSWEMLDEEDELPVAASAFENGLAWLGLHEAQAYRQHAGMVAE